MAQTAPGHLRFAVVAVDAAIFTFLNEQLCVLLMPINLPPHYPNSQGLPGGIIKPQETTEEAVERVLAEKVALSADHLEQLATFSRVDRDKRNRVVSVGYLGFVRPEEAQKYQVDREKPGYFLPVREVGTLAYDHNEMLDAARARLIGKLAYTTIAQFLLPKHFTLTELQVVYEVVQKTTYDKRNFRKKILALDIVKETGRMQEGVKNRPAALYQFNSNQLSTLPLVV